MELRVLHQLVLLSLRSLSSAKDPQISVLQASLLNLRPRFLFSLLLRKIELTPLSLNGAKGALFDWDTLKQKCHRLGGLNKRHLLGTVMEAGQPTIVLASVVPDDSLPGLQMVFFVSSRGGEGGRKGETGEREGGREGERASCYKGTNPIMRAPSS